MLHAKLTMYEAFQQVATARLDQEALVCDEVRLTYSQLLARIDSQAQGLAAGGVGKGAKVACLLPPGPEFVSLFFALARLGAVIVPLNPQLRQQGMLDVLQHAQPIALVSAQPVDEELLLQEVPSLHHFIPAGTPEPAQSGDSSLSSLDVSPQDLLALLYTSGTTGQPKGTMHTHRSLIAPVVASIKLREIWLHRPSLKSLGQTAKALGRYRTRLLRAAGRPQTFLSTAGWHTITGLEVVLQALLMGDRLVVMPRFHPRQALQLVEQERVTVLIAVPLAFQMMLSVEGFDRYDTSSLLICGTGAAPCPTDLARQMQHRFDCAVHIGFGATETAGGIAATSLADSAERQAATVGQPMPGMEVRVVDEARRLLPPGEVGELAVRSDSLMLGYYNAPDITAQVIDADGWYYTGDLAVIDALGYLRIVGRKKDLIIRGGLNVYPAEIESYLASNPRIREAAVVGIPSPLGSENVWAFIILKEGMEMSATEVLDYCRAALEPYKIPSQVRIVADFPRTETGKPQKFKLREKVLQGEDLA